MSHNKIVIFSDFDGTITERDVIIMIMEKFAPSGWTEIKDRILYERSMSLKEGVESLFGLLESRKKDEIVNYIKQNVKLRNGFNEFLDFCESEDIKFNVLSGGLDFHIDPVLESYKKRINIFCNNANFNLDRIKIDYKFLPKNCISCGECGCCKIEIIENYPRDKFFRVIIGDSLTDLAPSKIADLVFARGDLIKYLEQDRVQYIPFKDFFEVKEQLQKQLLTMKK